MTLIDRIVDALESTPEMALFLCLALGFAVGKVRVWKISLGGVAGTLVVAILVGMLGDITLDDEVKTIAFALFIFTLGYISGPTFVGSLNRQSLKYAVFTVIEIASVLGITAAAILIMRLDVGTAAGLLAGGATESAVVGTATDAIARLPLSDAEIETLQANVGTAYSISYICGLITIVLLSSQIFPLIMRVSLRDEAAKLWKKLGGGADEETATPAAPRIVGRVYRVETAAGQTVERVQEGLGDATAIERISRAGRPLAVSPDLELAEGDEVLVVGLRDNVVQVRNSIGEEVAGDDITMDIDIAEVVFTSPEYRTTTLGEFKREVSVKDRRGVFLQRVTRGDQDLPVNDGTVVQHGDIVRLVGATRDLDRVVGRVGFRLDPRVKIDLVFISAGIVAGFLIGGLVWQIGNIPLTLGTGGGCLLTGLLFGWIRSKRPTFGQYDSDAADVIKTLGLAVFICAVGLSSGPQAVALVKQFGIGLPIAGVAMTAIPACVSLLVAWKVMRLPAPLTLGAITGQQCSTPGVTAVQQAAGNATPLMAYTIVYAFSNVALPLLGPVVVAMAHAMGS
ncbi:aspartate-alanine antiporter [Mycolicibacterium sp. 050232]|uniref:aspartate-alanine antiporter n=1 Tax=Mycolicibacterium sp. 050232 TaxID=3113982 RepID=UPI002E2D6212|nr:aspartate-alanine antiporter [Mycolicibacterium sp. 050232]MED5810788.1 aspartate-alanine antiporter [Mycolicibacterium sp. 050232]